MTDMRKQEESGQFQNFCRMAPEDFDHLLSLTIEKIRKSSTNFRDSIPAYDKLAVTLRFLATGDSYESLMYFTKMSKSTICNAISEVCAAINEALQNYAKTPSTEEEWLSIAQEFNEKWNFPNCIGAVDGKHCVIQAPINSGSDFFNYKSTFSVVLMAIVDANYNFIFADIGCQGRISDGGVFRNTSFYQKLQNNELNLPNDQSLPGRPQNMPFFPSSEEEWLAIAEEFERTWQFPNCLGAVDGKHVAIVPPAGAGSLFFNYKGYHSIVLIGIANANYEFIYVDIGTNGRISERGVCYECTSLEKRHSTIAALLELSTSN
ncbi:hypothetical protein MSG28_013744 [Choristoneura fumiferana]|uniref:Uncharacterized protein n=1 Tax=Choristoneura fumiferana TaxID=7141 RepID=A0ACC0K8G2_CHOFU|nr:hypothetical protein MSG28_013744 [Choristoneura fumiferana]